MNPASTVSSPGSKTQEERVDAWMPVVVGALVVVASARSSVIRLFRVLQAESRHPGIGVRYYFKRIEYHAAVAASVRHFMLWRASRRQRAVSELKNC